MTAGLLSMAIFALFVTATVLLTLYALREAARQMRGVFGRPYASVVAELSKESARRSRVLTALVERREGRLARLERRGEASR